MPVIRRREPHPPHSSENNEGHNNTNLLERGASGLTTEIKRNHSMAHLSLAFMAIVLLFILLVIVAFFVSRIRLYQIITLIPVGVCLLRSILPRRNNFKERLLPITVVATTIFAQLPAFFGFAFAAFCIAFFSLSTLPPSSAESKNPSNSPSRSRESALPVLLAALLLIAILLTENFMVWVVSASFEAGQLPSKAPPALQDNGQILVRNLTEGLAKVEVVGLRRLWNVQGALVACLGVSFVIAEMYKERQLYSLGRRAVLTLAVARTIRTVSFMVTVLPSQNKYCYRQHFPYPPPNDWVDWIWVGFMPSKYGGCNDLIISGHATVTSTLACVATSVSGDLVFGAALWSMVAFDYLLEIYEGFHYSVDMWLGMVLVCLLWRVLEPVEDMNTNSTTPAMEKKESNKDTASSTSWNEKTPSKVTIAVYSMSTLLSFLQLVSFPSWTVNFFILVYTAITATLYLGFAIRVEDPYQSAFFQHTAQHFLYCLLYVALGEYL